MSNNRYLISYQGKLPKLIVEQDVIRIHFRFTPEESYVAFTGFAKEHLILNINIIPCPIPQQQIEVYSPIGKRCQLNGLITLVCLT